MRTSRVTQLFVFLFLLATLALSAGCGSKEVAHAAPDALQKELVGKVWICETIFTRAIDENSRLTLEFMEDGTVRGTGGCNDFAGSYELAGDAIKIGPLRSTRKACSPATDELEFTYLSFMQMVQRVEVDGEELHLHYDQAGEPMVFSEEGSGSLW